MLGPGPRTHTPGSVPRPQAGVVSATLLTGPERPQGGASETVWFSHAETLQPVAVVFSSRKHVSCA